MSHTDYLTRGHFPGLDGLRCFAIIAVVWHHSVGAAGLPMLSRGFLGVDLFFVLSGFLITTLLLREKAQTGRISLRNFWVRRILRLAPAYYALLFGLLAVFLLLKPGDPATEKLVRGFPIYALYLSNWFDPGVPNLEIMWSLATEEQFYLVWPAVEALVAATAAWVIWVAALVVNQLINFGVLDGAIESVFGVAPHAHPHILDSTFTPILLGVGLAHALNARAGYGLVQRIAGGPCAAGALAAGLLLVLNIPRNDIAGLHRLAIHVLMMLFLAGVLLNSSSATTRVLAWRPIAYVGVISYGIYLYHMLVLHVVRVALQALGLPEHLGLFVLGTAGSIAVATASYYLYEVHFLRLRNRFRPHRAGAPVLAPALSPVPETTRQAP